MAGEVSEEREEPACAVEAPSLTSAEEPACAVEAPELTEAAEEELEELTKVGGYLLPTDEIVVDDDLPVLITLPRRLRERWGNRSRSRTWE